MSKSEELVPYSESFSIDKFEKSLQSFPEDEDDNLLESIRPFIDQDFEIEEFSPRNNSLRVVEPEEAVQERAAIDPVEQYFKDITQTPLLTREEETDLGRKIQAGLLAMKHLGDQGEDIDPALRSVYEQEIITGQEAETKFTKANLRLVVSYAKKYVNDNHGLTILDLIQEGNFGLMHAVRKFDPERGFKFSTYGTWWIKQSITRAVYEQGTTIHLPTHVGETTRRGKKMIEKTQMDIGRELKEEEIESVLSENGLSEYQVKTFMDIRGMKMDHKTLSLDMTFGDSDTPFADIIVNKDYDIADEVVSKLYSEEVMTHLQELHSSDKEKRKDVNQLSDREYNVIVSRFGLLTQEIKTLEKVGSEVGLTRERVRQVQFEAMKKVQNHFAEKYGEELIFRNEQPKSPQITSEIAAPIEKRSITITTTLYERAADLLSSKILSIDPEKKELLALLAQADKETFAGICDRISSDFNIPRNDVFRVLLNIVESLEHTLVSSE